MRITRVFLNVDIRNGHIGLAQLAKEHRIDVNKLDNGEIVVFINTKRNKMKVYASNQVLAYVSRDTRISLDAVKFIPLAFGARGRFDYDEALRLSVNEALAKGQRKSLEVY